MSALAAGLRRPLGAVSLSARMRRRLVVAAAAFAVLASLYVFWLRDSSLVSVERVAVTGLETRDAERVQAALTAAARSMTTLHVDHDRLREAVAGYPVVRDLRVDSELLHGLKIEVVQHDPAAIAVAGSSRVAVAGDGTVLRGVTIGGSLPELRLDGALPQKRLSDPRALRLARVAGAAPLELRRRLEGFREGGERGLTVRLRQGPLLIFGGAARLRAKWIAAARVLAHPSSRGATYIDLRLPDRPAAGGVAADTLAPLDTAGGAEGAPAAPAAPQAPAPEPAQPAAPVPAQPQPPATQAPPTPQQGPGGGAAPNPQP